MQSFAFRTPRGAPQDDDDPGILKFSYEEGKEGYYEVQEGTDREVTLTVERYKGSSGRPRASRTEDRTHQYRYLVHWLKLPGICNRWM